MNYKIHKMIFPKGVHFGSSILAESEYTLFSDTIFSALCIEAINTGGETLLNKLLEKVNDDKLVISDALPYIDTDYYIPKPVLTFSYKEKQDSNDNKKAAKNLKYIPIDLVKDYLEGELNCTTELDILKHLGKHSVRTQTAIRGREDSLPYSLGVFNFSENAGLYICIGYEDEKTYDLVKELFNSLQYSGLGGKRKTGVGSFRYSEEKVPEEFERLLKEDTADKYMLISCGFPQSNDQLHRIIENSTYQLIKRSGFVQSNTYSDTQRKKKNLYVFKSGSCFDNKFTGKIFDVSEGGEHAVYRYAKPMYVGVKV